MDGISQAIDVLMVGKERFDKRSQEVVTFQKDNGKLLRQIRGERGEPSRLDELDRVAARIMEEGAAFYEEMAIVTSRERDQADDVARLLVAGLTEAGGSIPLTSPVSTPAASKLAYSSVSYSAGQPTY